MGKLIKIEYQVWQLLISCLQGSISCLLNRSACLAMSTSVLKALPGKLDIKRHSPSILYKHDLVGMCSMTSNDLLLRLKYNVLNCEKYITLIS